MTDWIVASIETSELKQTVITDMVIINIKFTQAKGSFKRRKLLITQEI